MSNAVQQHTINGKYDGELRTTQTHNKSNVTIVTDAPTDNNGKGESFSPTDLIASALAGCILTVAAIRAAENNFDLGSPTFTIDKIMQSDPRKVKEIRVEINFNSNFTDLQKRIIERAAKTCPVALSLHESINQKIDFVYPN